jgi:hypothetical protein
MALGFLRAPSYPLWFKISDLILRGKMRGSGCPLLLCNEKYLTAACYRATLLAWSILNYIGYGDSIDPRGHL